MNTTTTTTRTYGTPPPFPDEPEASVSAAEFLEQLKDQRAFANSEEGLRIAVGDLEVALQLACEKIVELKKQAVSSKRSKLLTTFVLCAVFALGAIVGAIGGHVATDRYELFDEGEVRIDKLTGKVWILDGGGGQGWELQREQN